MTPAQEQLQKFKSTLGTFGNPRPRDVDTPANLNGHIDRTIAALEGIRPAPAPVEDAASTLDLTTDGEDPPARRRKRKKKDPNRMHTGGEDREA